MNLKCGLCKASMTGGYQRAGTIENFSRLGPEYLICPYCGGKNKTRKVPWTKLTVIEKLWLILMLQITYCIYGGGGGFIIVYFICTYFKIDLLIPSIIGAILGTIILSFFQFKSFVKGLKSDGY